MSGHARARRRALEALSDDSLLTPLGTCKAQVSGEESVYLNYPKDQARAYSIEKGTEFYQFIDPRSGTIVSVPVEALEEVEDVGLP